jgi:hypothetical protein
MWLFGDVRVVRGTVAWTHPLRLKATLPVTTPPSQVQPVPAAPVEFDEDGRVWVFRYTQALPRAYRIERDRIFTYIRQHRLPGEIERQLRRDARNAADFFTEVREL